MNKKPPPSLPPHLKRGSRRSVDPPRASVEAWVHLYIYIYTHIYIHGLPLRRRSILLETALQVSSHSRRSVPRSRVGESGRGSPTTPAAGVFFLLPKMGGNYSGQGTAMNCQNSQIQLCFQLEKEPLRCSQTSLSFPPGGTWQQGQFHPCCLK